MSERGFTLAAILLLLPLATCQTYSEIDIMVPAVSQLQSGTFVGVPVRLNIRMMTPGTGEVFVNTRSLTEIDMQGSARVAAMVAGETTGEDIKSRDFLITLYASTTIIGGPSAGAAMTVAMIALLKDLQLSREVMITGMITPDGALGVVGGIPEKAYAAYLSGAKYFLVPEGQSVSYNSTTYEAVNVTQMAKERWNLSVVEVSDIREAVKWFTGLEFQARPIPSNPVYTESYIDMMRRQSLMELGDARSRLDLARILLEESNLDESLKSDLGSVLASSEEDLHDGYDAFNRSRFYVASSKAFQSRIASRYVAYSVTFYQAEQPQRTATIEQIWAEVEVEIESAEAFLAQTTALGIEGLECVAAAKSRIQEARSKLEDSRFLYRLQIEDAALHEAAYSAERARTAKIWSNMTLFFSSLLLPSDGDLREMAEGLVADASILATYADLLYEEVFGLPIGWVVAFFPEYSFIDPYESLEAAETAIDSQEWAVATFEALEAELRAGLAIEFVNVLVLAADEDEALSMMTRMANKSEAAARIAIDDSRNMGVEPVLSVSRYEFSENLCEIGGISALGEAIFGFRFARSAARLSRPLLDLYRPRLEVPSLNGSVMASNATVTGEVWDPNGDQLTLRITIAGLKFDCALQPGWFSISLPTFNIQDGMYTLVLNLSDGVLFDLASFNVLVDNNPPAIQLRNIGNGTAYGHGVKPDISVWDAADPDPQVQVKLDGEAAELGEVSAEGRHVLHVTATDRAGWSSELEVVFWIDAKKPTIIPGYPACNGTFVACPTLAWWSSADALTAVVRSDVSLDGGPWCPARETSRTPFGDGWESRFEFPLTGSDGPHNLSIRAIDAAGNEELVTVQITLDGSPPEVRILGVSDGKWYNQSVAAQVWTRDALDPNPAVVVQLDGEAYVPGSPVGHGRHLLVANATDSAGNTKTITVEFVVDLSPPSVRANVTEGVVLAREITIEVSLADDLDPSPTFEVLLDARPYSGEKVGPGKHALHILAWDKSGNSVSVVAGFAVDLLPPAIEASVEDGAWYAAARMVTVTVADDLDANPAWVAVLDGETMTGNRTVGEGAHELLVGAMDWAGNSAQAKFTFRVDSTPPQIAVSGVRNGTFYRSPVVAQVTVRDELDPSPIVECSLDGSPYMVGGKIGDGNHTLYVSAVDRAGNSATLFASFAVDTIPPRILVDVEDGAKYKGRVKPTINATDDGGLAGLDVLLDGNRYRMGSKIGPGTHTLLVVATDLAGNEARRKLVFTVARRNGLLVGVGFLLIAALCAVLVKLRREGRLEASRRPRRGVGL